MSQDGFWAGMWTKITSVRQGTGVVGQLSAVMIATLAVLGLAVYFIGSGNPWVTIPLLLLVGAVIWFVRDFIQRGFKYGDEHPEYASVAGQQTVQIIKAQASREKQAELPPTANVAPPMIDMTKASEQVEDKREERPRDEGGEKPR